MGSVCSSSDDVSLIDQTGLRSEKTTFGSPSVKLISSKNKSPDVPVDSTVQHNVSEHNESKQRTNNDYDDETGESRGEGLIESALSNGEDEPLVIEPSNRSEKKLWDEPCPVLIDNPGTCDSNNVGMSEGIGDALTSFGTNDETVTVTGDTTIVINGRHENRDVHSSSVVVCDEKDDAGNDSGLDGDLDNDEDIMIPQGTTFGSDNDPVTMAQIGELSITKPAPDFSCNAVVNGDFKTVKLSDYRGKYVVLFFYPLDFTFVCPTEIIAFSDRSEEFRAIGCEILACSTDSVYSHLAWVDTPRKQGGLGPMKIPLMADKTQQVAKKYGCFKEDEGVAFRGLFIIDDKGNLRQITINDLPVGRSVDETLRLVQAFQFTDKHGEVCPAGWKPGKETMKPDPKESQKYFKNQ